MFDYDGPSYAFAVVEVLNSAPAHPVQLFLTEAEATEYARKIAVENNYVELHSDFYSAVTEVDTGYGVYVISTVS